MQYNNRSPIYLQVIDRIQKRMVMGEILPGDKLPSTRALAVEYEVNPNTAARIYKEMEVMGLCYTERGLGTFMTDDKNVVERLRRGMADKLTREFCARDGFARFYRAGNEKSDRGGDQMMQSLSTTALTKRYARTMAVDGATVTLNPGAYTGCWGPTAAASPRS